MICTVCSREIEPTFFCSFCDTYTSQPTLGWKAGIARRWGALILDGFALWTFFFVILALSVQPGRDPPDTTGFSFATFFWAVILHTVFSLWFLAQGKTVGKWLLGMQVVRKNDGSNPGLGGMLVREIIGKTVSGFFLGIGYFAAIWDRDSQAWHDKIAGTVVLRTRGRAQIQVGASDAAHRRDLPAVQEQAGPSSPIAPASQQKMPSLAASAAAAAAAPLPFTHMPGSLLPTHVIPDTTALEWKSPGSIVCSAGEHAGKAFSLDKNGLWIGRDAAKCQIVLNRDAASRQHAWIVPLKEGVFIIDQGSTNGTYINSTVNPRITREKLNDGDRIYIGKQSAAVFTFLEA